MNRTSHIERIRQMNASIQARVQKVLNWDDMRYALFQQQQGFIYLGHQFGDAPLVSRIPEHKEFWSWWRMHWLKRDSEFLDMTDLLFPAEIETYYIDLHSPESLAFRPHAAMMERTYMKMIHGLVKQSVK